jgi:hypothetical protein
MVDSHPKRWDLWSIYIDMEAGQNDIQSMRSVGSCLQALYISFPVFNFFSIQKYLRSCVCSKNDKPQGQVSHTRRLEVIIVLV